MIFRDLFFFFFSPPECFLDELGCFFGSHSCAHTTVRVPWCYWVLGGGLFFGCFFFSRFFEGQSVLPDYVALSLQPGLTDSLPQPDVLHHLLHPPEVLHASTVAFERRCSLSSLSLSPPDPRRHRGGRRDRECGHVGVKHLVSISASLLDSSRCPAVGR